MHRPVFDDQVPRIVGREHLEGRHDGVGLGRVEQDRLVDLGHHRSADAREPGRVAVDRRLSHRAFQHHVAEVHRRPLTLRIGEVPPADVGKHRSGAARVPQLARCQCRPHSSQA